MEEKLSESSEKIGEINSRFIKRNITKITTILVLCFGLVVLTLYLTDYFMMKYYGDYTEYFDMIQFFIELSLILSVIFVPLGCIVGWLYTKLYISRFSYDITNKFIVIQKGVFISEKMSIPFSRIQNINVYQGIFDKLFHIYSVKIETAGSSDKFAGSEGYIPGQIDPKPLENIINQLVNKYTQEPYRNLQGKVFENADLAFDEFAAYFLRKLQEGSDTDNNIEKWRTDAGLSREQLAEEIGVSRQTIYYLEKGKYQPSLKIAMLLAEALDKDIKDMFSLTAADKPKKKNEVD